VFEDAAAVWGGGAVTVLALIVSVPVL